MSAILHLSEADFNHSASSGTHNAPAYTRFQHNGIIHGCVTDISTNYPPFLYPQFLELGKSNYTLFGEDICQLLELSTDVLGFGQFWKADDFSAKGSASGFNHFQI